jgi:hypothetical protein
VGLAQWIFKINFSTEQQLKLGATDLGVEIQTKKVGYEMEMRVKFECGIWLRNGNFMAVNLLQTKQKQKIKHQLNLQKKWTNGSLGWLQMELKIST